MKWLPNALTILRCILAFVVGWAISGSFANYSQSVAYSVFTNERTVGAVLTSNEHLRWIACGGFILGAVLDFLDGWLARRLNAVSAFGRLLDPIADKLLVGIPLLTLGFSLQTSLLGKLVLLAGFLIVFRDITITVLRFSSKGGTSTTVTQLAKWKTAIEFVAIALPLVALATSAIGHNKLLPIVTSGIGLLLWMIFLYLAAILSLYTGYQYARAAFMQRPQR